MKDLYTNKRRRYLKRQQGLTLTAIDWVIIGLVCVLVAMLGIITA